MISREELLNLATLARLELQDAEIEALQKDISTILEYVGQVSAIAPQGDTSAKAGESPLGVNHNGMREDLPAGEAGVPATLGERDSLLKAFPKQEGGYNVVRKIIQKDE